MSLVRALLALVAFVALGSTAWAVPMPLSEPLDAATVAAFRAVYSAHPECVYAVQEMSAWDQDDTSEQSLDVLATVWVACYRAISPADPGRLVPSRLAVDFCAALYEKGYDTERAHLKACAPLY